MKKLGLVILCLWLGACSKSSRTGEYVRAPDIDFECSFIQSPLCDYQAAGKVVFMGLTQDLNFQCENQLVELAADQVPLRFDYHGYAVVEDRGTHIFGVVTQWANAFGAKILNFLEGDYRVCAFLDDNGNGQLDYNEVVLEDFINPEEAFFPLSSRK